MVIEDRKNVTLCNVRRGKCSTFFSDTSNKGIPEIRESGKISEPGENCVHLKKSKNNW